MTASSPGRILVVLHETGYFRFYGSTIVELGRRGWDVCVAFDKPTKRGEGLEVPPGAGATVRSLGALPATRSDGLMATLRAGVDYLRYLEPRFAGATYLRRRAEKSLPDGLRFLTYVRRVPRTVVTAAIGLMRAADRVIPAALWATEFLSRQKPDVVFVSPLVTLGVAARSQTECVKAARRLGIPVIVGVASWDHLTSKGLVRVVPDALTVWNETQVRQATELHRIPRARVIVSGAQSLDHWFAPADPGAPARLRRELGIEVDRPLLLYVGSSKNMAPGDSEPEFVRRWVAALRARAGSRGSRGFVIVRPHPGNLEPWRDVTIPDAVVYPTSYSGMPLSDAEVEGFRASMLASDAVVGVNTTAMIEAAILDRPVLTVRDAAFGHSQEQTLHFEHLTRDAHGFVLAAETLDDHVGQLEAVLENPGSRQDAARAFVGAFVRPLGTGSSATGHLCDSIERVALAGTVTEPRSESAIAERAYVTRRTR